MLLTTVKNANLGLTFLLELAVLASLCYWGFTIGSGILAQIILGVGSPVLVATIWGWWGAPRSAHRLHGFWFLVLRILFFGAGSLALFAASQTELSVVLAALVIISLILVYTVNRE